MGPQPGTRANTGQKSDFDYGNTNQKNPAKSNVIMPSFCLTDEEYKATSG